MTLRLPRFRTGLPNEHFGVESAQELEQMAIYALLPYYLKRIVLLDTPALKDKLGHSALWQLKGLMESAARKAIEAYEVGVDPGKGESSLDDLDYKIERLSRSREQDGIRRAESSPRHYPLGVWPVGAYFVILCIILGRLS